MANFKITIQSPFTGYAPGYWKATYPTYGNRSQAASMQNVNLIDPTCITQGPGLAALTNGTQAGKVTTLIKGILDMSQASNLTFATGGNLLYELSATTVSSKASAPVLPHVIDKAAVTGESGEDVAYYKSEIYYSYNYTGGGDIGKYDLTRDADADFDDDYMSTTPTGATALSNNPHQMEVAGTNGILYIANGQYVAEFDGTTFTEDKFDTKDSNAVVSSIKWNMNRLFIAANKPNVSGSNKNQSSVYIWDGNSASWENRVEVMGRISALYVKNGVTFVFHEDITSSGGYKLGYISGTQIIDVAEFAGALPAYYQVSEYENFIIWGTSGLIYAWGSAGVNLPTILFQLADGGHSTLGGVAAPFGTPMIASNVTTSYQLAKFSGYDTACNWKGMIFDTSGEDRVGYIDKLIANIKKPSANAKIDLTLRDSQGTSKWTDSISYTSDGAITKKIFKPNCKSDDIRLEMDWSNGNATNPLSVKSVIIIGHTIG